LVCNGEIYNYEYLKKRHGFNFKGDSDCEVILHLYARMKQEQLTIKWLINQLDGVFSFVLFDKSTKEVIAARDPIGVRPAFLGESQSGTFTIASEAKAIVGVEERIRPFPPGYYYIRHIEQKSGTFKQYYDYKYQTDNSMQEANGLRDCVYEDVREYLTDAVRKRLMSDREIGCLLSGGLDSSLITALVASQLTDRKVKTFSIGLRGSPDLKYAKMVAEHIGSDHHQIQLTQKQFLKAVEHVVYVTESWDITTIRASVGNYLVANYISKNTDCKVIFNGDGADEVCGGYVYNVNAPSADALQSECVRLVKELYCFDVLRSDRSISSNGLEARTPFLDKAFVNYYMSIPAVFKKFGNGRPEKYILRKAFDGTGLLPHKVLWRPKCAFSDGVSSIKKSWHTIIQKHVSKLITDDDWYWSQYRYDGKMPPPTKEALWYRQVHESFFGFAQYTLIPHYWLPRWTDVTDPSARMLSSYKE
jgi:asparagine synthase (glutamine-hydrolysing)